MDKINYASGKPKAATLSEAERAQFVRDRLPPGGLFAGLDWRISPEPFALGPELVAELEGLGRVLLQFYRAVNLLYRKSVEGRQPQWIARWLDQGKPERIVALQRAPAFKNDVPRVIRPDLLLTPDGLRVTELDSVPGGIGLTGWLNQTYSDLGFDVIGGSNGMLRGFEDIFGDAARVHIVISEEAATYRPEMVWVAQQVGGERFIVRDAQSTEFADGDAVYRFFELFDVENVACAERVFASASARRLRLTPPPKAIFEEKMLFALLWNRNLRDFWRQELGGRYFENLRTLMPETWVVDPAPLPPQGAIAGLDLTDWRQLQTFSQKERELILKVSGFSAHAWGARGVYLGSDLSQADWAAAVENALRGFERNPFVLQKYHKPRLADAQYFDFEAGEVVAMKSRVRLCPYYFVRGEAEQARATLGGVLATICPADKKIIHGMADAIAAPCATAQ
jgi:hypothetical protein